MGIIHWVIFIIAILVFLLGASFMAHQVFTGLDKTNLNDKYVWGVNIQGFYFLSAVGIGIMAVLGIAGIYGNYSFDQDLFRLSASIAFACLICAQILMGADLGNPRRALKVLFGKKFLSPLFLDFFILGALSVLAFVYMFGIFMYANWIVHFWVWGTLFAAIFGMVVHTLLFVPRVGAGYQSEPFESAINMACGLWAGSAIVLVFTQLQLFYLIMIVATAFVCVSAFGSVVADLLAENKPHNLIFFVITVICAIILFATDFIFATSKVPTIIACIIAVGATYFEKQQTIIHLQKKPVLPEPYSQFERRFVYKPVISEWLNLVSGIAGVVVGVYIFRIVYIYLVPALNHLGFFRWVFGWLLLKYH